MRESIDNLKGLVDRLLARPDEIMLALGAGGELLVARLRALLSLLILVMPIVGALAGSKTSEVVIGLSLAVFINLMAQIWLGLARRPLRYGWLPYATGAYDITLTTLVLSLLALGDPVSATNSIVVWCFYLLAIAITALRNDGRLTLFVTALALAQYAILVTAVFSLAPARESLVSIDYGTAAISTQIERLILILMMGLLTSAIVYRMQRLVEMSGNDGLTGLPNRAWLLQGMPRMFETIRNDGGSLTLALLDLDRFKRINDEIGPRDGDRALRHFVAAVNEILQEKERLVRIGGQEFVVLMHCPIGSAWERLDRLRRSMGDRPFLPESGRDPQVITFSGGLAAYPQDGGDVSALLGSADRRLQLAKHDGRNRVVARDG
ncbi:GGDEF domain-containing protein [Luteimonas mephitis]|uniref:GGDEF domain-containing protein n=1 Tax=Luteimonas mephitis TaxID=83615 RepID=UPI000406B7B3|nr:GGDEF domain-containing protein [Luteimonas mephitis]